jgi:predicted nucleic acid-binding protein
MNDRTCPRYYFDANALVKYYREEQGSLQIKRLVSNSKPILISPLTLVECVSVFMNFFVSETYFGTICQYFCHWFK